MKRLCFLFIMTACFAAVQATTSTELKAWRYAAQVTLAQDSQDYGRLSLTPAVYDAAQADLNDLRLMDSQNEPLGYLLVQPADHVRTVKVVGTLLNRVTTAEGAAQVTLDCGRKLLKNILDIDTAGDNFRRGVKIEGSPNNTDFYVLFRRGYVFAVAGHEPRFSRLEMPLNDFRYVRITVFPMPGESVPPVISSVQVYQNEVVAAGDLSPVPMTLTTQRDDEKTHASIYEFDLGSRHLPIRRIQLTINSMAFYRYVQVEGRDELMRQEPIQYEDNRQAFREVQVPWQALGSQAVYRYLDDEGKEHTQTALNCFGNRRLCRYLRITINNYDDAPIVIAGATALMLPHQLVFEKKGCSAATLYVGNDTAAAPVYDLSYRLKDPLLVAATAAQVGTLQKNPLFAETDAGLLPWTEEHRLLLLLLLAVVVLVLAGFIWKSFKAISRDPAP